MPYSFTGPNLERVPASLRRGSWLFLDHAGRGVQYGRDHAIAGVVIETLGFLRPHATPGASSWSPSDADYDIVGSNCDLLVRDTLHLCSPRGLLHNYGGYGRFEAERVRGNSSRWASGWPANSTLASHPRLPFLAVLVAGPHRHAAYAGQAGGDPVRRRRRRVPE